MSKEVVILPYEARQKLLSVVHFIRAGLEKHAEDGIVDFTYAPCSKYHEEYIENEITLRITFKVEYTSEKAKEAMKPFLNILDYVEVKAD